VAAEELQLLDALRLLALVSPQARSLVGDDDVELARARGGEERLVAGAVDLVAADAEVGEVSGDVEGFATAQLRALAELVVDGCLALLLGGDASV
jgi:hypothetical protein